MNTATAREGDASHERPPRRSVSWADEDNQQDPSTEMPRQKDTYRNVWTRMINESGLKGVAKKTTDKNLFSREEEFGTRVKQKDNVSEMNVFHLWNT